ncbi:MAG: anaerobic sulfite reductase subunit AsrB [Firmicutes bacterium]|nr:anaerobic sulfite reductase subunit AsrB [Bacillota bacterium]
MVKNPYLPFKAKILDIKKQTDIDWTYRLECSLSPEWGQFVEVSIPGVGECPISISDFGDDYIELTIRRVGKVTDVIHQLNQCDNLFIRGPYGKGFPIPDFYDKHLIIAAGGTGLAPVKSIINHFYDHPDKLTKFNLLIGFKTPSDFLFKDEIDKWKDNLNVTITVDRAENDNWDGNVGLITNYVPKINIFKIENVRVVVVGPPVMMKFTVQEFIKLGVPEENIWVSFERKMCCGVGKCGHCKIDDTYVCLEGPVFNYTKAKKLID